MRNKAELREKIFRHLDGIVTAPTAYTLHRHGVLAFLLEKGKPVWRNSLPALKRTMAI
jgi:hypothetical protein